MTSLSEERFVMKEENPNQWIDKGLYFFSWEKTRKKAQGINGARPHFAEENGAWPHLFSPFILFSVPEKVACPPFF
jgi:hypothetical protein